MEIWEAIEWLENAVKHRIQQLEDEKNENDEDGLWYRNNTAIRNYREALRHVKENLK